MYLNITPPLSTVDQGNLGVFTLGLTSRRWVSPKMTRLLQTEHLATSTKSLVEVPPGYCVWEVTKDGKHLFTQSSQHIKISIKWLMFLIYHYFRPLNYEISGIMEGSVRLDDPTLYKLGVRRNMVCLELTAPDGTGNGFGSRQKKFIWNPAEADKEINTLCVNMMKLIFERSGLKNWKVIPSINEECHIDPQGKMIFLSNKQLFRYSKQYGIKGLVNMIKTRMGQIASPSIY